MGNQLINLHKGLRPGELKHRYRTSRHETLIDNELSRLDESIYYYADEYEWQSKQCSLEDHQSFKNMEAIFPDDLGMKIGDLISDDISIQLKDCSPNNASVEIKSFLTSSKNIIDSLSELLPFPNSKLLTESEDMPRYECLLKQGKMEGRDIERLKQIEALFYPKPVGLMVMIVVLSDFWIRPLSAWVVPEPGDNMKIVRSLVRHLFVYYPVPEFLYNNWKDVEEVPTIKWVYILIIIGQGASLYSASKVFGWNISKKILKYLFSIPDYVLPAEGFMCAETMRLGGSIVEFERIRRNPVYNIDPTLDNNRSYWFEAFEPFWQSTVKWLSRHRNVLTEEMCDLILEWSMHMFTEFRDRFSWKGQSIRRIFEAALEYRRMLEAECIYLSWDKHGWEWEYEDSKKRFWTIIEITSARGLYEEGCEMHHCVGSYGNHCVDNRSAIFSLRVNGRRILTIEVAPGSRKIVQVRGIQNRSANSDEQGVVDIWEQEVLKSSILKKSE